MSARLFSLLVSAAVGFAVLGCEPPPPPDDVLRRRVAQALTVEPSTNLDVKVDVYGGVVRLQGVVDDPETKALAHRIAASVPGVVAVDDAVRVKTLRIGLVDVDEVRRARQKRIAKLRKQGLLPREPRIHAATIRRDEAVSGELLFFPQDVVCTAAGHGHGSDVLVTSIDVPPLSGPVWEGALDPTYWRRWEPVPLRSRAEGRVFRLDTEADAVACAPDGWV